MTGHFAEKKGFDVGIRALARGLRGVPDARLALAGGGELEASLQRPVAEERIQELVRWVGRPPFAEFMAEVGAAHLGMYPSREGAGGDSEGGAPVTLTRPGGWGSRRLSTTSRSPPPPRGRSSSRPTTSMRGRRPSPSSTTTAPGSSRWAMPPPTSCGSGTPRTPTFEGARRS
jgi:hypothetical protein